MFANIIVLSIVDEFLKDIDHKYLYHVHVKKSISKTNSKGGTDNLQDPMKYSGNYLDEPLLSDGVTYDTEMRKQKMLTDQEMQKTRKVSNTNIRKEMKSSLSDHDCSEHLKRDPENNLTRNPSIPDSLRRKLKKNQFVKVGGGSEIGDEDESDKDNLNLYNYGSMGLIGKTMPSTFKRELTITSIKKLNLDISDDDNDLGPTTPLPRMHFYGSHNFQTYHKITKEELKEDFNIHIQREKANTVQQIDKRIANKKRNYMKLPYSQRATIDIAMRRTSLKEVPKLEDESTEI
jgi:hypothetical protein